MSVFDEYFTVFDKPVFCWFPRTLLTLEIAWLRTVYGRKRRSDGRWEYYNQPVQEPDACAFAQLDLMLRDVKRNINHTPTLIRSWGDTEPLSREEAAARAIASCERAGIPSDSPGMQKLRALSRDREAELAGDPMKAMG